MTNNGNGAEDHLRLEMLVDAAKHLDRWSLQRFRARIDELERDDSPELDMLTERAARLSRSERHQLHQRIAHLHAGKNTAEHDLDDDMDYAETLLNENFLA